MLPSSTGAQRSPMKSCCMLRRATAPPSQARSTFVLLFCAIERLAATGAGGVPGTAKRQPVRGDVLLFMHRAKKQSALVPSKTKRRVYVPVLTDSSTCSVQETGTCSIRRSPARQSACLICFSAVTPWFGGTGTVRVVRYVPVLHCSTHIRTTDLYGKSSNDRRHDRGT